MLSPLADNSSGIDPSLISLFGMLVPLLVAAVTKSRAAPGIKAIVNLLASGLVGVLATAIHGDITPRALVTNVAIAWFTSIVSHYGLWKPTGVAPVIAGATADVGLGTNEPPPPPPATLAPPTPAEDAVIKAYVDSAVDSAVAAAVATRRRPVVKRPL